MTSTQEMVENLATQVEDLSEEKNNLQTELKLYIEEKKNLHSENVKLLSKID